VPPFGDADETPLSAPRNAMGRCRRDAPHRVLVVGFRRRSCHSREPAGAVGAGVGLRDPVFDLRCVRAVMPSAWRSAGKRLRVALLDQLWKVKEFRCVASRKSARRLR
jgi:hypothetical protein